MKRWQIIVGVILIIMGLFSLVEAVFDINMWNYLFPLLLIGVGLLLILRPRYVKPGVEVVMPVIGDTRREGAWEAGDMEIWSFVGTSRLDFSQASFPNGVSNVKINGFVVDAKIILPEHVGLSIDSASFVNELKSPEGKEERFLNSIAYQTPNYLEAENRINIQTFGFVTDVKVTRI